MDVFQSAKKYDTLAFVGPLIERKFITISLFNYFFVEEETRDKLCVLIVSDKEWISSQISTITNHTSLNVVDKLDENESAQVIVLDISTFLQNITDNIMNKISLIVIHEIQLVLENDDYKKLSALLSKDIRPRIVAFAPSLIYSNYPVNYLMKAIDIITESFRLKIDTSSDLLNSFSRTHFTLKPKCKIYFYRSKCFVLKDQSQDIIRKANDFASFIELIPQNKIYWAMTSAYKMIMCLSDFFTVFLTMGYWTAFHLADIYIKELSELSDKLSYTERNHISFLLSTEFTIFYNLKFHLKEHYILDPLDVSPKMLTLLKIIRDHITSSEELPLCGIIFASKKYIVRSLHFWLQNMLGNELQIDYLIESCTKGEFNPVSFMTTKRQEQALYKFRKHETQLLIVTTRFERDLEVSRCNLVIRYDFPETFMQYMHSKTKLKQDDGLYALLLQSQDEKNKLREYVAQEEMMKSYRNYDYFDKDPPEANNFSLSFKSTDDPDSAQANLSNASAILHRYCQKLPSDYFTRLTPQFYYEEVKDGFQCTIRLPNNSLLRHGILGETMQTKKLAKKAAALEAVKQLHQLNELNDNFCPYGKKSLKYVSDIGLESLDKVIQVNKECPRTENSKPRQFYRKKVADVFIGSPPTSEMECNLYAFILKLTCPIPEEQNTRGRKIDDPSKTTKCFGMLTSKIIPKVCDFPVFTRSGEVMVSLTKVGEGIKLTNQQLMQIASFHKFTFHDVLHLDKLPMKFNPIRANCSYFIAPVDIGENGLYSIDWKFMEKVAKYEEEEKMRSEETKEDFVFVREKYEDAVVKPGYRQTKVQQHYYVAEICDDLNLESPFPLKLYNSFADYYATKHNKIIKNVNQPLLDADYTSAKLNLLTPRYVNPKGVTLPVSSVKTRKERRENLHQKQFLVPELCIVHPFPASFWRKAVCLPCIIYRINSLLIAEQLRKEVAQEIGVGSAELKEDENWPALNFGWTLSQVLAANENSYSDTKRNDQKEGNVHEEIDFDDKFEGTFGYFDRNDFENKSFTSNKSDNNDTMNEWNKNDYIENNPDPTEIPNDFNELEHNQYDGWGQFDDFMDGELSRFTGLTGLTYISGCEEVDIGRLTRDLADCVGGGSDEEIWSDEDAEFDPSYVTTRDDSKDYKDELSKEASECGLLTNETQITKSTMNAFSGLNIEEIEPYEITFEIGDIFEIIHSDFDDNLESEKGSITPEMMRIFIDSLALKAERCEEINDAEAKEITKVVNEKKTEPGFGELLPNREKKENEKSDFSVSFDNPVDDEILKKGPSPAIILQALTMSNASDGINLERLETVGDSFLKFAVTVYLYWKCPKIHEGKLSFWRSLQISNKNLYKLGSAKGLGELMVATKFEPNDNWLPPGYFLSGIDEKEDEHLEIISLNEKHSENSMGYFNSDELDFCKKESQANLQISKQTKSKDIETDWMKVAARKWAKEWEDDKKNSMKKQTNETNKYKEDEKTNEEEIKPSYCLLTQHSIPDKSIADCVEALIGAYLISCGSQGALLFMKWLGLKVMDDDVVDTNYQEKKSWTWLPSIECPNLTDDERKSLMSMYKGYRLDKFEQDIGYVFREKAFLIQAFTHNSFYDNHVTECYQRLEFLGDAVLDFLITRHLFEDPQKHSPGILTDLRSALVNNTFFAKLAVKYHFQKYIRILSSDLMKVLENFVDKYTVGMDDVYLLMEEAEYDSGEDVEVPKALGDIFESVAGAIYIDSGGSLDTVWSVYYPMMRPEIEFFSKKVPRSPIRELLEMFPQKISFGRYEIIPGGKVRMSVEVFSDGKYVGIGRNKRLAKSTAAKIALRDLKRRNK